METAQTFRKPAHKIGFLLSCGYFNAAKRFFSPKDYQQRDIDYVAGRLSVQPESFDVTSYANRTRQRHEHIILEFYGFKRFDNKAESLICQEINSMVHAQLKPKLIFGRCLDLLIQNRIQLPSSRRIVDFIQTEINQRKLDLARLIEQNLSPVEVDIDSKEDKPQSISSQSKFKKKVSLDSFLGRKKITSNTVET